jgi:hypothetical protein
MNVGIGTEAALFPEKEYIVEIYFAVRQTFGSEQLVLTTKGGFQNNF